MPKISTGNTINITTDKTDYRCSVDVYYDKKDHFRIEIPDGFRAQFDAAVASNAKLTGRDWDIDRKMIVVGETEKEVLANFESVIRTFLNTSLNERPVIVIKYGDTCDKPRNDYERQADSKYKVGLNLQLIYCTEVSLPGTKLKYYKYTKIQCLSKSELTRRAIDVSFANQYSTGDCIIDDTPENREYLEMIHANIEKLAEAMKEYTKSPGSLLGLITSNQKLIG